MHHDGCFGAHGVEHPQRLAARHHVVLAENFEPVDAEAAVPGALEDLFVVHGANPDSDAEIGRFGGSRGRGGTQRALGRRRGNA